MARTSITPQRMQTVAGQALSFVGVDASAGMECQNTGAQVALVQCATGDSVSVSVPSQPDGFGRIGDAGPKAVVGPATMAFGPFSPPVNWGDAASKVFFDFTNKVGAPTIAVVTIGG